MIKFGLRVIVVTSCFLTIAALSVGCKSNKTTDNADNQITNQGEDIGVPPVPPEPTRPAQ